MSPRENLIFTVILAAAVVAFLLSAFRLIRLVRLGQPDPRLKGEFSKRLRTMFLYAFAQKRVVAEGFGYNHLLLFWGFMVLFVANGEFVISGLFPGFSLRLLGSVVYPVLTFAFDLMSLIVLICVALALFRRSCHPPGLHRLQKRGCLFDSQPRRGPDARLLRHARRRNRHLTSLPRRFSCRSASM